MVANASNSPPGFGLIPSSTSERMNWAASIAAWRAEAVSAPTATELVLVRPYRAFVGASLWMRDYVAPSRTRLDFVGWILASVGLLALLIAFA